MAEENGQQNDRRICELSGAAPTFDWEKQSRDEADTGEQCEYCGAPVTDKHCHGRCPCCGYYWSCSDGGGLRS